MLQLAGMRIRRDAAKGDSTRAWRGFHLGSHREYVYCSHVENVVQSTGATAPGSFRPSQRLRGACSRPADIASSIAAAACRISDVFRRFAANKFAGNSPHLVGRARFCIMDGSRLHEYPARSISRLRFLSRRELSHERSNPPSASVSHSMPALVAAMPASRRRSRSRG